jgi:hypothetical protein
VIFIPEGLAGPRKSRLACVGTGGQARAPAQERRGSLSPTAARDGRDWHLVFPRHRSRAAIVIPSHADARADRAPDGSTPICGGAGGAWPPAGGPAICSWASPEPYPSCPLQETWYNPLPLSPTSTEVSVGTRVKVSRSVPSALIRFVPSIVAIGLAVAQTAHMVDHCGKCRVSCKAHGRFSFHDLAPRCDIAPEGRPLWGRWGRRRRMHVAPITR